MAPATVSVPLASRPYYRTHRRDIETAVAAAVKTVMEEEPEDPIAGLASHFARYSSAAAVDSGLVGKGQRLSDDAAHTDGGAAHQQLRAQSCGETIASEQSQQVLEQAAKPILERFADAVTKLVQGELHGLFDAIAAEFEQPTTKQMPTELRVAFVAELCNRAFEALRAPLVRATSKNAKLCRAVGDEAMGELKLVGRIATASKAKVVCGVEWTAPAQTEEVKAAAAAMGASQAEAVKHLQAGETVAATKALDELFAEVGRAQMPLYKTRVAALMDKGGQELYVQLPAVVRDLLPKFEKVRVAGSLHAAA